MNLVRNLIPPLGDGALCLIVLGLTIGLCGPFAIGTQAQALADPAVGQELKLLTFERSGF